MAFTFADAINAYVGKRQSIHPPDAKWHPSAIFGCSRQAIYAYRDTPETNPRDSKSQRTMWLGTQIHTWLQAAVTEHPEILEAYSEVHIDAPELNIVGDADVLYRTAAGWELGEVKSIGAMALKYAKELPKEDHKWQALTYLWALRTHGSVLKENCSKHPPIVSRAPHNGKVQVSTCPKIAPLGDQLRRVCFAYIDKDDLGPHEAFVQWKPAYEAVIREKIEYLSAYANDPNSLPPRLPLVKGVKPWNCNYCPFKDQCWQVDPKEVEPEASIW